ncbi:MAG: DNA primase [Lachnospiraceae bacterium]|nr:DNA primase [Lachnospiraceae bacterium]
MFYPEELIEEVRVRNDIVDIISPYVSLKKSGSRYTGLCPFHNEKTPSFSVSQRDQLYYCFGCHAGGNVYTFLQKYENMTFPEAIRVLADRAGITLPEMEMTEEMKQKRNRRQRLFEINNVAAKYFYYQLRSERGELGKHYFEERKLSAETQKKFGLGYSLQYSDDLIRYLRKEGYTDDVIRDAGLGIFEEREGMRDKFINRVMFPIQDQNGKVIGFGGRVMGEGEPKYLNSPETEIFEKRKNLYGLHLARSSRAKQFILCEGYMDVISMHQAGFTQAVASLGTAFTPEQAMLLKRFGKDIYLAYDSDGAGTNAALKAVAILREAGISARVIDMRPYKDPDEFIKNLGQEEYQKRIDEAENGFLFEIRILRKGYQTDDPAEKTKFETEVARKLCVFTDELERGNYLNTVAEQYGIPKDSLKKKVISEASIGGLKDDRERFVKRERDRQRESGAQENAKYAQRLLLTWLSEEPERYSRIRDYIGVNDFTDPLYRRIAERMLPGLEDGSFQAAAIIDLFEELEDQQAASRVFHTRLDVADDEKEKAFRDIVIRIKQDSVAHDSADLGVDIGALDRVLAAKKVLEKLQRMERL